MQHHRVTWWLLIVSSSPVMCNHLTAAWSPRTARHIQAQMNVSQLFDNASCIIACKYLQGSREGPTASLLVSICMPITCF